jgi:CRISPR/Cas system-associated exonuclease Cas4 (RecB family)
MAQERLTRKTELLLRHEVIEEYMEVLGRLAADEIVDQSEELSQLTTKLQSQAGTSPEETEAFGKIAGVLTNAIGDKWRKRQIQELIERSNGPLQTILKSLKKIVVEGFGGDDQNEQFAIQSYYQTKIAQSNDPAGIAALKEWQERREKNLVAHTQAIQAYAALLEKISEGHQKLYDGRNELAKAQLIQQIKQSVKELKNILDTIKKI